MENVNRNDVIKFFEDMQPKDQEQAIRHLQSIIKKPPERTEES